MYCIIIIPVNVVHFSTMSHVSQYCILVGCCVLCPFNSFNIHVRKSWFESYSCEYVGGVGLMTRLEFAGGIQLDNGVEVAFTDKLRFGRVRLLDNVRVLKPLCQVCFPCRSCGLHMDKALFLRKL